MLTKYPYACRCCSCVGMTVLATLADVEPIMQSRLHVSNIKEPHVECKKKYKCPVYDFFLFLNLPGYSLLILKGSIHGLMCRSCCTIGALHAT